MISIAKGVLYIVRLTVLKFVFQYSSWDFSISHFL